jgi:aspartokinase-like uncharacterized kinase
MDLHASCVIKLGGSLLGLPDLRERLDRFLAGIARPRPILIAGGGAAVQLVREWDRLYRLGEEASHWIALRVLSTNTRVVAKILPDRLIVVDSPEDCAAAWRHDRVPIYDSYYFVSEIDDVSHNPLPREWRVTSDSIAARMAVTFGAPELILLKSVTIPDGCDVEEAARQGWVDPWFPVVARHIGRITTRNLRGFDEVEHTLAPISPER